jgi:hypothetical protein
MHPAEFISGQSLIVFGILVVALVFVVRRTMSRSVGSRRLDDTSLTDESPGSAESRAEAVTEALEVRLHDFASEVEGRMMTRIAVLDRLIVDADREIRRLQEWLAVNPAGEPASPLDSSADVPAPSATVRQPDASVPRPADQKEAA